MRGWLPSGTAPTLLQETSLMLVCNSAACHHSAHISFSHAQTKRRYTLSPPCHFAVCLQWPGCTLNARLLGCLDQALTLW